MRFRRPGQGCAGANSTTSAARVRRLLEFREDGAVAAGDGGVEQRAVNMGRSFERDGARSRSAYLALSQKFGRNVVGEPYAIFGAVEDEAAAHHFGGRHLEHDRASAPASDGDGGFGRR